VLEHRDAIVAGSDFGGGSEAESEMLKLVLILNEVRHARRSLSR
jgi:hypothetical protein